MVPPPASSPTPAPDGGTRRLIGVDTGGTFTDLVLETPDGARVVKLPSTPADPGRAVADGLGRLCTAAEGAPLGPGDHVVHGTTVGLNALLTRDLAPTALVTNAGFRDLVEIGRQERPDIYALHPERPAPVVPRELRFELAQRSWPDPDTGAVVEVERPDEAELARVVAAVGASGARSVAVCLLHAWADPGPELRVAEALATLGLPVTTSAALCPEFREVERFSTATINAALAPVVGAYLARLEGALAGARLSLLQSNGGTLEPGRAAAEPARLLLSGPAGGVAGAARAAAEVPELAGTALVTLDMGGTSTDVAFHAGGGAEAARLAVDPPAVGGLPVQLPSLDVHTIAAGGGSLADVDAGGVLHVGPASAGADPGPVAYGKSDRLTLTDAFVQLGRIRPGAFLDGGLELDEAAVARAFEALGARLGVGPDEAAAAMVEIGLASMGRAVSTMTLQRGRDPRDLCLVAFGGAGGLVGVELARALGFPRLLVPADPGVLSARGLATAAFRASRARSLLRPLASLTAADLDGSLDALDDELRALAGEAGLDTGAPLALRHQLDLRYAGQSYQLELDRAPGEDPAATAEAFARAHERFYGYRLDDRPVELVHLRAHATAHRAATPVPDPPPREPAPEAVLGEARVWSPGSKDRATVLARARLAPGTTLAGPAVLSEYSGTTWLPAGAVARVTGAGHLLVRVS